MRFTNNHQTEIRHLRLIFITFIAELQLCDVLSTFLKWFLIVLSMLKIILLNCLEQCFLLKALSIIFSTGNSFCVKLLLDSISRSRLETPSFTLYKAIIKRWLCKKDQKLIKGIQTFTYCSALMFKSLATSMITLTVSRCFNIKAHEWPLRKLIFWYRMTRHCKTDVARKMLIKIYMYRPDSFKSELVCF